MPVDLDDMTDFENADRGFIGTINPMVIKASDGRVVWDMDWGFLEGRCLYTVNPSLWRQARLTPSTVFTRWPTASIRFGDSRCPT
jgi:alkyl sulfatase BDS1-like metallo-beta-lactamase superfamily hydrolase